MRKKASLWIGKHPILAIVIVTLLAHVVVAIVYGHITPYPDSSDYIYLAQRILAFDLYGYQGQRSPGYPLLLSILSNHLLLVVTFQSLIGVISLIITYKTCLLLGLSRHWALILTLALSLYLPIILFEYTILTESLTWFVLSILFYVYFRSMANKELSSVWQALYIGLLCGYLVLIKPFYLFTSAILATFWLVKKAYNTRILLQSIIIVSFSITVFWGWSYVNKLNTGYFVSTTYYGYNLAQNCVRFAEKTTPQYTHIGDIYARYRDRNLEEQKDIAMSIWAAEDELRATTGLSFAHLSALLYDYSKTTIEHNPQAYIKQVGISWRDFWKTSMYWEQDKFALPTAGKVLLYISYVERIAMQIIKVLFILLIPYNIICFIRKRKITPTLIISIVVLAVSVAQAIVTYGTNSRFSYPFEVLIAISVMLNIRSFLTTYRNQKTNCRIEKIAE